MCAPTIFSHNGLFLISHFKVCQFQVCHFPRPLYLRSNHKSYADAVNWSKWCGAYYSLKLFGRLYINELHVHRSLVDDDDGGQLRRAYGIMNTAIAYYVRCKLINLVNYANFVPHDMLRTQHLSSPRTSVLGMNFSLRGQQLSC